MKNKGFTLIELLVAILIISLLSGIVAVGYKTFFKTADERYYDTLESNVLLAGNDYFEDHRSELPTGNDYSEVTLANLIDSKYIEPITDTKGNECRTGSVFAYRENNKYKYEVCLVDCGGYNSTGRYCAGTTTREITVAAKTKTSNKNYDVTKSFNATSYAKSENIVVTINMANDYHITKYLIINIKDNSETVCNTSGSNQCVVELNKTGTYKIVSYEGNNEISFRYINAKIAKNGSNFTLSTSDGKSKYTLSQANCSNNVTTKKVKFNITKGKALEEYKSIEYRVNDGEYTELNALTFEKDFTSGHYDIEVIVTNYNDNVSVETLSIDVTYLINIEYDDDTTETHEVVKGQNYNYISPLPTTKVINGKSSEIKWYIDETLINATDIVNQECTYTIQGKSIKTYVVTYNNNLGQMDAWGTSYKDRWTRTYDSGTGLYNISLAGAGGWELLYLPITTTANHQYKVTFDYQIPTAYSPLSGYTGIGYQAVTALTNNNQSANSLATSYLPSAVTAKTGGTLNFTATGTLTYFAFNLGMAADGATTTFKVGNVKVYDVTSGTYVYNPGSVTQDKIKGNQYGTLSTAPTRSGYTFNGWYTAPSGGTKIETTSVYNLDSDQVLYAHWTMGTYTQTYRPNGGVGNNSTETIGYWDVWISKPVSTYTKTGSTFSCWQSSANSTCYVGNGWYHKDANVGSSRYLDATWTANTYKVNYIDNLFAARTQNTNGVVATYTEKGSYLTLNGTLSTTSIGELWNLERRTINSGDVYKITINYVSGSLTCSDSSACTGSNGRPVFVLDLTTNGASFSDRGTSPISYKTLNLPTSGSSEGTITVDSSRASANGLRYWIWQKTANNAVFSNYKVQIIITKVHSKNVSYGSTYGTLDTPTKTGYTFNGWYTAIADGTKITNTATYNTEADQTLYAQYTSHKLYVQYNGNGSDVTWCSTNTSYSMDSEKYEIRSSTRNVQTIGYGQYINYSAGFDNWNNTNYTCFAKSGYMASTNAEWILNGKTKTYDHNDTTVNAIGVSSEAGCNLETTATCTARMNVNWVPNNLIFNNQSISRSFSTSAQTFDLTVASNGTGTYTYAISSQPSGNYFTISGTKVTIKANTPAGSHVVVIKATDSNSKVTKEATYTVAIAKVNATCPTISDWTGSYDGSQHSINVSGGSGGSIQYRWNSTTEAWRDTKPTASVAGTWKVYVQMKGDSNHNTVDCGYKTLTINKVKAVITCANKTYNGSAQTIATCAGGTISGASQTNYKSGGYSITCAGDSNHTAADAKTCSINQKALTITAKAQTINYGTSIATGTGQVTTDGLVSGDSLTAITLKASTTNATTSGTITPSAATTSKGIGNYSVTYKTGVLKINKASGYINISTTSGSIVYGTASAACFSVSSSHGGTISITDDNSTANCSISGNTVTCSNLGSINAGTTIKVTAKSAATTNYTEASKVYTLVVNKATPTLFKTETSKSIFKDRSDTYGLIPSVDGKITSSSNSTGVATVSQASNCSSIGAGAQCVITITGKSVGSATITHTFTPNSSNYNSVTTTMPVTIKNNAFTVTFAGVNPINTSFDSQTVTLAGNVGVPAFESSALALSTNTNYVVSFDYKCASGSNQFDVDFFPDTLPQTNPTATTTLQHMDWITSSSNSSMSSAKLRFFDDFQASNESDITITNIMLSRTSTKTVYYGSTYGDLPAPTRSGYTFDGWYTASNGGTKITSSSIVSTTSNHTLYARWTKNASSCYRYSFVCSCSQSSHLDGHMEGGFTSESACKTAAQNYAPGQCTCTCKRSSC